mmetsp:Transcript_17399/g.31352  ORF Transcript_17399/g.31352 Transcript_17399/m.31352 type:complete len:234 (-) Transcript_17399:298-999(-)
MPIMFRLEISISEPMSRRVSAVLPIHPGVALEQVVQLGAYVLVAVATPSHLHPKVHELLRCDNTMTQLVHFIEHGLHTNLAKRAFEESCGLLRSDPHGVIRVHLIEEVLAFFPCPFGQLAEEGPSRKGLHRRFGRVARIVPIDPCSALDELFELVYNLLLLVASFSDLHPEVNKLFSSDGTTSVNIHLVEEGICTQLSEGALEESHGLLLCHSIAVICVHESKALLDLLPSLC